MKIAIIGGGAAGFFLAIHAKQAAPQSQVVILEKGQRVLAKVSVSGGGRCNLTNSFKAISDSGQAYPRGARLMKRLLHEFSAADTYRWFEANGVPLVTQEDECVFPVAQNSAAIINCLTQLAGKTGSGSAASHISSRRRPQCGWRTGSINRSRRQYFRKF